MTFDIFQVLIAAFGCVSVVLLAFNRILLGCVFGLACYSVWVVDAIDGGRPGAVVVLCIFWLISALGVIGRLPRRRKTERDEHEKLAE